MDPKYASYCGRYYCVKCAYHTGSMVKAAQQLHNYVQDYRSLQLIAENAPFSFNEFQKGVEWLSSQTTPCKGCRFGGGWSWWPDCPVRTCCSTKGIDFCYQCPEFPCKKLTEGPLKEHLQRTIDANRQIQRLGLEKWLKKRYKTIK